MSCWSIVVSYIFILAFISFSFSFFFILSYPILSFPFYFILFYCFILFLFFSSIFVFGPKAHCPNFRFIFRAHFKAQQKSTASAKPKLVVCSLLAQQKQGPRTRPNTTTAMHEQLLFSFRPCTNAICSCTTPASSCFTCQSTFMVTRRAS